jgi:hypothetical protein
MRDGTPWGWEDAEVAVNVSNWHLLTADALTYGYIYGGDAELLERAREAFKTGSNPNIDSYEPVYTATKEATNSANFGLVYMHRKAGPASPSVETQAVTFVSQTTASCGGNVTSDGGAWVSERGICWGMSSNPTTADAHTHDGTGTGSFSSSITGLSPGTHYHVRAYATNSAGTSYGSDVSFTTQTTVSLAEALDNIELTWTTGGNGSWFGQNLVSGVDSDSAQSPDIADGQSTYFETAAAGPCAVSFFWKTSSESGHDYLRFYIDGAEQAGAISGETSWQTASHTIAGGSHTLKWAFTKDGSGSYGADCGWVDGVFKGTGTPITAFIIPFGSLDNGNINIGNPASVAAGVSLRVIDATGSVRKNQNFSVPGKGVRRSWDLIGNIYDYGKPVSAEILSDRNLVADNIKWASPPYETVSAGFTCSPVSLMAGTLFYFPFSSFGGWSNAYCVIVNTAASTANVTIDVYDSGGAVKKTSTFSVESKATVRSWDYVGSIQSWADPALLRVTSDRDIVVEAVRWEENKRGWGFSIFPSSLGGGTSFIIPFGSLDNGNINLANISGGPAGVTMRIRDAAGTSLAAQNVSIPARGVVRSWDLLGNLYGYGKPLTVEVTSGASIVGDNIKWASPPYDTVGAGFTCGPASLMKGKLFYYPFNSAGGTANAYCVISNTTSSASNVTIDVYDANGNLMKTTSFAIAANGVVRSWDSVGSIQALADPALIRITSSQDVVVEAVRWEQNKRGWGFAILPTDISFGLL